MGRGARALAPARPDQAAPPDAASDPRPMLSVRAGGDTLALPVEDVAEIIVPRRLTRVPRAPAALLGIAGHRGAALPVLSLAMLRGGDHAAPAPASRIVVMASTPPLGLWVDQVAGFRGGEGTQAIAWRQLADEAFRQPDAPAPAPAPLAGAAAAAAPAPIPASEAQDELSLLPVHLAGQDYALKLADIEDIAAMPEAIAPLPGGDPAMLGVALVRGATLPLLCLRALLGLPPDPGRPRSARILVVRVGGAAGCLAGLRVDGVRRIVRVRPSAIDPVPHILSRFSGEARIAAICRLDGGARLLPLLSAALLFDAATTARLQHARAAAETSPHGTAQPAPDTGQAAESFLVFRLGTARFGLAASSVEAVVRHPGLVTKVPRAPAFLQGLMNLRGQALPLIDQRLRFGIPAASPPRHVLVVGQGGQRAGFCVDAALGMMRLDPAGLRALPQAGQAGCLFDRVAGLGADTEAGLGADGEALWPDDHSAVLLIDPAALMDDSVRGLVAALRG